MNILQACYKLVATVNGIHKMLGQLLERMEKIEELVDSIDTSANRIPEEPTGCQCDRCR